MQPWSTISTYTSAKLIDHLKAIGEYENTLILFMSDNGPEGNDMTKGPGMPEYLADCCDNSYENIGNADSYVVLGSGLGASRQCTFAHLYKSHTSQGGIRVPAIRTLWPAIIRQVRQY